MGKGLLRGCGTDGCTKQIKMLNLKEQAIQELAGNFLQRWACMSYEKEIPITRTRTRTDCCVATFVNRTRTSYLVLILFTIVK